jgi:hypothetical protein
MGNENFEQTATFINDMSAVAHTAKSEWDNFVQELRRNLVEKRLKPAGPTTLSISGAGWVAKEYLRRQNDMGNMA